jgi:hypothetical protein
MDEAVLAAIGVTAFKAKCLFKQLEAHRYDKVSAKVDRARGAEIGAGLPACAIQRDQPAIQRAGEDPQRAGRAGVGLAVAPGADAAQVASA